VLEKRVALLSVVIGVCDGCTCDSGRCGRPVRWVAVAECGAWAWWRCTAVLLCPIEDRGTFQPEPRTVHTQKKYTKK
jgi:hypothetical protein